MRKVWILLAGTLALTACGKTGLAGRNGPDELAISRAAPLIVPSDFNLTPPRPGEPRAITEDGQSTAIQALFGSGTQLPPKSPAEQQLLDKAGAGNTDPAIRSNAGDPKTSTVNKGAFVRELLGAPVGTRNAQTAAVTIPG